MHIKYSLRPNSVFTLFNMGLSYHISRREKYWYTWYTISEAKVI